MSRIAREHSLTGMLTFTTSVTPGTSRAFAMGQDAGGILHVFSAGAGADTATVTLTSVTIEFLVDPDDSGTTYTLHDSSGTKITMSVNGGRCYPLPDALFGAGKVYILTTTHPIRARIGLKT